jgi:hypothetical protein
VIRDLLATTAALLALTVLTNCAISRRPSTAPSAPVFTPTITDPHGNPSPLDPDGWNPV